MSPLRKMRRGVAKPAKRQKQPSADTVYIRFGELPEGERSEYGGLLKGTKFEHLYHDVPEREAGVSVWEARRRPDGSLLIVLPQSKRDRVQARCWVRNHAFAKEERPLYFVSGRVVGKGASGEPLLRDCSLEPVPLTTPVRLPPPEDEAYKQIEAWNLWRRLDAADPGHRTPFGSDNMLEAFAPESLRKFVRNG